MEASGKKKKFYHVVGRAPQLKKEAESKICYMFSLPSALIESIFPAARKVMGQRVCKQLHDDLQVDGSTILLVDSGNFGRQREMVKDFHRVQQCKVALEWRGRFARLASAAEAGGLEQALVEFTMRVIVCRSDLTKLGKFLLNCKALSRLDLSNSHVEKRLAGDLAIVLSELTFLTHLLLRQTCLQGGAAGRIAGGLRQCKALELLDLRRNHIFGGTGGVKLAGALGGCTSLTHLDLGYNGLGSGSNDAVKLVAALVKCVKLSHLDLRDNLLADDGAFELAGMLGSLKQLAYLNLNNNEIYGDGGTRLAAALGECKALLIVRLRGNHLDVKAAASLAWGLHGCEKLTSLDLGANGFGDAGAMAIAGVLERCTALSTLCLDGCNISHFGARELAFVLGRSPRMELDLTL